MSNKKFLGGIIRKLRYIITIYIEKINSENKAPLFSPKKRAINTSNSDLITNKLKKV